MVFFTFHLKVWNQCVTVYIFKMNILTKVLPAFMKDSLLCHTFVNSKAVDEGPDIAICNSSGYLLEVKNRKIVRCLFLSGRGTFIRCIYQLENEKIAICYLVLTQCHKLLLIKRNRFALQIVKTYKEVKDVEIYDFEGLGFPQMKVRFYNLANSLVLQFSENSAKISAFEPQDNESDVITESLEEKVQILNEHLDKLNEEYYLLRKLFSPNKWSGQIGMTVVGSIKFSQPVTQRVEPTIKIINKWVNVFGSSLTLGMKVQNNTSESIRDVELLIKHNQVNHYVCRIFEPFDNLQNELFATPKACESIKPGDEVWVIGAFCLPEFVSGSALIFTCCLTSGDSQHCLLRESFEVTVLDIASRSHSLLEDQFGAEDLMAIRTVKSETRLEVRTEDMERDAIGLIMTDSLGFRKMKHLNNELFYCTSAYLNEVFVALKQITENPSVWKMVIYTSENPQIYFLVNALYELLPENTSILCEEM